MPRDCHFLPCFRRRRVRATPQLPNPVLLVSGIGGSILSAKNTKTGFLTRAWVRIFLADLEFKKYLWSIYNAKTAGKRVLEFGVFCFVGYTESLDPSVEVVVPQDDHGLYAIDILDPSWTVKLLHLTDVYHFHEMINMLTDCGYEKGTTLFGYGYDFRQSNRIDKVLDGLKVKLATAYQASGGKRVDVISHSMGGLLMLSFMSLHHDVFAKYVNKWICIACPFQGAPGYINDSLLTGLQFVYGLKSYFFVPRWTMHQLLVECPSIYEMLPNPKFKWKKQPVIQVWRKQTDSNQTPVVKVETFGTIDCTLLFKEALRNNELKYAGKTVPLPFNQKIFEWAAGTRQVINNAQLPNGVSFYNIFGTSFDTPFDVCYGSETSPIDDFSQVCHLTPQYSYVDGDGTVPAESAKADGLAAVARVGVKASHRGLLSNEVTFQLIRQWLGVGDEMWHFLKPETKKEMHSS